MDRFALGIGWRIIGIVLLTSAITYFYIQDSNGLLLFPLFVADSILLVNLYRYVTSLNRKLTRFLESVRYSDFAVAFRADSNLGPTFQELNDQFNEVLDAFRQARAEKEANLHYVNTIVQHVSVGLLTFDSAGQVELVNQTALRLLGSYRLRTLNDLNATHPDLADLLRNAATSPTPVSYQTGTDGELSVRCTAVRLRGRLVTVVSMQNIRTELQQRELDAWQNLTKVLRHEIMNSITPIVSLAGTMRDIVETDLVPLAEPATSQSQSLILPSYVGESINDLRDALVTIEQRGAGVMQFVDAYRHFTTIPQPIFADVPVEQLLRSVVKLAQANAPKAQISCKVSLPNLAIRADTAQIEMVLINLIKNAVESLGTSQVPVIHLQAEAVGPRVIINVTDNGPGIEPEALEQIFIPFYTTKKSGSGIGLSLSRQIMQLHNGQLSAESTPGAGSTFSLTF
ncbi:sensor histidine kinase [Spirosoma validum]|uniref:histidine kinase n=1 Tax=Spirosoma validum TaxID=2771355 RepID=A0A927B795_9BACT|nr:PAS domain-containing sensor histidine kinase [Spirosoma validum]MBD2757010.1 PAS domain-containing sensor histidine kinase [Spirosoma validum]